MPLFKAYFLPEVAGNEPADVDLGLTSDAVLALREYSEPLRTGHIGTDVRLFLVIAEEDIPSVNIREGDVVWKDWTVPQHVQLPPDELERQMRAYRPIWEPGPGWLKLRQERWGDVEIR